MELLVVYEIRIHIWILVKSCLRFADYFSIKNIRIVLVLRTAFLVFLVLVFGCTIAIDTKLINLAVLICFWRLTIIILLLLVLLLLILLLLLLLLLLQRLLAFCRRTEKYTFDFLILFFSHLFSILLFLVYNLHFFII